MIIQGMYKDIERFGNIVEKGTICRWPFSVSNIIQTLLKFYSYVILLNMSVAYFCNIARSYIHIFSHVFWRLSSNSFYGLFNPFFRMKTRCSLQRNYKKLLVATQQAI